MGFFKSKAFLLSIVGFLLVAIPITTYVVVRTDQDAKTPQAATVCESNCATDDAEKAASASADLNDDGVVNTEDLNIVVNNMGKTGDLATDLNNDNVVSDADLVILQSQWTK